MPLSWLASTLTNGCDGLSNPWFQEKTNVLEPRDKTLCSFVCFDSNVAPNKTRPSKVLHGYAQHTFNP